MEYTTSVPFTGSADVAMNAARTQLMANGFKVDQSSETELAVNGPGMHSTRQNPILGVSRATITISSHAIDIHAELGGARFMQKFLYIFPPALCGFLAIVFACIPTFPLEASLLAFGPILPWLVISPLMAGWIKIRTTRAVDTLVHNMANAG